jgi:hypothetical protein
MDNLSELDASYRSGIDDNGIIKIKLNLKKLVTNYNPKIKPYRKNI